MSRLAPLRQKGFGLLVFVLMASIVALSIVLGYSGLMTREEANRRPVKMQAELDQYKAQLLGFYQKHAATIDSPSAGNAVTFEDLLAGANIPARWGMRGALSKLLPGDAGLYYRRIVLFYPTETDDSNPPNLAEFVATGVFKSCAQADAPCDSRLTVTLDSMEIHRAALQETQRRLERLALKAQAFFKARMLQDPEKNISVNYFRSPFGDATTCLRNTDLANPTNRSLNELECVDTYTPLVTIDGGGSHVQTNLPRVLGLAADELVSGWGDPVEASNLADSESGEPPYTMVFRTPTPFGGYVTVRAIQQI